MADVIWSLRDSSVTPVTMGELALQTDCRTYNSGTDGKFFPIAASVYGCSCRKVQTMQSLRDDLSQGALAVCCMGPGYWTSEGHYICVYKCDGTNIYADDPNSYDRTSQSVGRFRNEVASMWTIK